MQVVSLRDLFSLLDDHEKGFLGKTQFQRAVALLGRGDISDSQCTHILKGCTDDGTMKVGYPGFCRAIQKIERERTPLVRQLAKCKLIGRRRQVPHPEEWVEVDQHRWRKLLAYLLLKHPFLEQRLGEVQQIEPHDGQQNQQGFGREVTLLPHPQLCAHSHCTLNHDFLQVKWKKQPPRWDPSTPSASWASLSSKLLPPPTPSSRSRIATASRLQRAGLESVMSASTPSGSPGLGQAWPELLGEHQLDARPYTSNYFHHVHRPASEPDRHAATHTCLPSSQASPPPFAALSHHNLAERNSSSPGGSAHGQAPIDSLQAAREIHGTRTTTSSMPRLASDVDASRGSMEMFSDKSHGIDHRPQTAPEGAMVRNMYNVDNRLSVSRGSARSASAFSQSTDRRVQSCEGNYWNWGSAPLQHKVKNMQSVYQLPVQSPWRLGKYWNKKKSKDWDHPTPWRTERYHARGSGYEETHMHNMAVALMKSLSS